MKEQQGQATSALSEAGRLRQVLDTARGGLNYIQFFKAIGNLDQVVAACDEAYSAIPGFANEIARLSGELDVIAAQLKSKQNEATEIYVKLDERNRVATERAEAAERAAKAAEDESRGRIEEARNRADQELHRDEERVTARKRALLAEEARFETESTGRRQLLMQREREAREQAELAEERLRELAASIPVPQR